MLIGVISDTHGMIRTEALNALRGADLIFHGGDIGTAEVIRSLEEIAPVVAVKGNCDRDQWSGEFPVTRIVEIANQRFLLIHRIQDLEMPQTPPNVVIFGHSHKSIRYTKDDVLYFNPGSAGPRRFRLPVTIGRIWVNQGNLVPEIIELFQ